MSTLALGASLLGFTACPGSLSFDYAGTGGSPGGNDGGVVTSCANAMAVLQTNCGACHTTASPSFGNLDLISANPAARLVDVGGSSAGSCSGKGNLLNSGTAPATGILIDKITGHPTCGVSMPFGAAMLNATDLTCLQQWANGLVAGVAP
jgi:hypothetical protein